MSAGNRKTQQGEQEIGKINREQGWGYEGREWED